MPPNWPADLPVVQVRIARPTSRLQDVLWFYESGLGLVRLGEFHDHAGYSGVMLGMPDTRYHLEFTERENGESYPPPSRDNLLVFYMPDRQAIKRIVDRLGGRGYTAVTAENPYWQDKGVTIEDPDGWRIVLMESPGI
ncbi:MAG: VOC family protein [Sulfobacillus sp.]